MSPGELEHLGDPEGARPDGDVQPDDDRLRPVAVRVRGLPAPDVLEFGLPKGHVCLVTDDGSATAPALVERLKTLGWPVVMLGLPESVVRGASPGRPLSTPLVPVVGLTGVEESDIAATLADVRAGHGPVGTCIYLHPRFTGRSQSDQVLAPEDRALLSIPFLVAKALQPDLAAAASAPQTQTPSRACFLTVTALDGVLGLNGSGDAGPMAGGIAGLTKTLRLEWPDVYCRAVDLDPGLDPDRAADAILAELRDPNRLVAEVGYGPEGRVTLERADGQISK